jgi:hypothetical protein
MGWGLVVTIIFWYLVIRVWILSGKRIPLIFVGLWLLAVFGVPYLQVPWRISLLAVVFLSICLVLIDRYQTTRSGM